MAAAMIIVLSVWLLLSLLSPSTQQEGPHEIEAEDFVLNLHYDHCTRPMKFSWKKLKCECPTPLVKKGQDCVCEDNCLFHDLQQSYHEGMSNDLPNYINEVFEEIDGEIQEGEKSENSSKPDENFDVKDEIPLPKLENTEVELTKPEPEESMMPDQYRIDEEDVEHEHLDMDNRRKRSTEGERKYSPSMSPWMQRVWNRWNINDMRKEPGHNEGSEEAGSGRRFFNRDRILWRMPRPLADELSLPEHRILFPRSRMPIDHRGKKLLRVRGNGRPVPPPQTFSDTAVSGSIGGSVQSGLERAQGSASVYRGTTALTIGADETGSAGSTAITGIGKSELELKGFGSTAGGEAWIGERAKKGSSVTSVLSGSGDAIAVNSLGETGSSSAAAISTKKTAGGATVAFGPASASVSATPGKGDTSSSASYNEGLNTAAGVKAEGGPIVESASVGDANQDINKVETSDPFNNEPIHIEPEPVENMFEKLFGR